MGTRVVHALTERRPAVAEKPCRRFELRISVGADTWCEMVSRLREIARELPDDVAPVQSISGSPSSYTSVFVAESPEQTHEKYIAELDVYIAEKNAAEHAPEQKEGF